MFKRITLQFENQVARVTLNRADKHNALDMLMFTELAAAQKVIKRDRHCRAVIIDANGDDFCSGLDIKSVLTDRLAGLKLLWKWHPWQPNLAQQVSVGWRTMPIPVIAVIQGRCWGGGLQIALGCDFRFTTPSADFSVMETRWGLIPDMGGNRALMELSRRDIAMKLAMSADTFDANEALRFGVITEIHDEPLAAAIAFIDSLCQRSPDAISAIKTLYQKHWLSPLPRILRRETWYQWRILLSRNQSIAVAKQKGKDKSYQRRQSW
ncbi:crotonase/enoyl-CoA hydratase family protein [Corallincola spongiicola]|uniref:Crotonase/enoyl-CoA hydratase family protein n=1 Tax=Corallincola spongiicola TaxID=2520508 RepID=A0ABY1WTK8_9GAMM|nr:crotonase/enoyl-CoA hydratase family protein [Corallincola spongiicola]TAA48075.1 crotonase/enoyl-CoA hydratase family protein [Corallincola spongiicola]